MMKKYILYLVLCTLPALLFTGCDNKCQGVVCLNGTECIDGVCKCPYSPADGYTEDCIKNPSNQLPTIKNQGVNNITTTTAVAGGEVLSVGGSPVTARGVCWSKTNTSPTLSDNKTVDGTGPGVFTSQLTGLTAGTTCYYRAYATNSAGTVYADPTLYFYVSSVSNGGNGPDVTDIDGNVYHTVYIGSKLWMLENLKVTKYRNGDPIPTNLNTIWSNTSSGAYAIYGGLAANDTKFGKLYNWMAVNDSRSICPVGWHVPSSDEMNAFITSLGGPQSAGGKLKSVTGGYWGSPNTGASNTSGFSARAGGWRTDNTTPYYEYNLSYGFFWTSSGSGNDAFYMSLYKGNSEAYTGMMDKNYGMSVRCVKD